MKTKQLNKLNFYYLLLFLLIIFSCTEDDGINTNNFQNTNSELNQGETINRNFIGKVVDESNIPIVNAQVSIGLGLVNTDVNGVFIFNNAQVYQRQAIITIEKSGYLKSVKTLVPTNGNNVVSVMMVSENLVGTINSGLIETVSLTNGTQVTFDGNFKDNNGNDYSGNIKVYMYHLEANNPDIEAIMPGNMQAINTNNEERVLETYGMLNVELRGDSGEKLNIADGSTAEIELLIDAAQTNAPSSIPLWSFNETSGVWEEEEVAVKQGNKYVASVSHFSWWNCDAQFPTVSLCLDIVDNTNLPLANVKVELWRANSTYPRIGYSNSSGEICGLIPSNEILTLKAFDLCGVEVYIQTIGPFSVDTDMGQVVLPTVNATTIAGTLVDCNNVNVTNGYVTLDYGSQFSEVLVDNGTFSFNVIQCSSLSTFTLEGVNYDAFQSTGDISFNFSNTNVGNIIACNTVTEFVTLQLDNNPVEYYLNNISTTQYGSTYLNISANTGGTNNYFYLGGSNTILGTYDSSVYTIEANTMDIDYSSTIDISYNLNAFGNVGEYIDMNFSGTYTDKSGVTRNVVGSVHVLRD
ncbi:carboxypeptidase-like regulatory domain-containing protein [Aurantibacter sp.]|uniref:carboxypeptidase-like regulatory domain-containing protein n=1 Tax=Aurantibacter sp. TaxID=2807103 RepID=UPI0035C849D1